MLFILSLPQGRPITRCDTQRCRPDWWSSVPLFTIFPPLLGLNLARKEKMEYTFELINHMEHWFDCKDSSNKEKCD